MLNSKDLLIMLVTVCKLKFWNRRRRKKTQNLKWKQEGGKIEKKKVVID